MRNIVFLPSRDLLRQTYESLGDVNRKHAKKIFEDLAKRVIEHSDELKRMEEYG